MDQPIPQDDHAVPGSRGSRRRTLDPAARLVVSQDDLFPSSLA
jgi:hypothetical protein